VRILFTLFIGLNFFDSSGQIQKDYLLYQNSKASNWVKVKRPIIIKDYFVFMDSIVQKNDSIVNYELTEHLLVRANPWIIDTLANTDYYRLIERDSFVYDQTKMMVFRVGDSIKIPDSLEAESLRKDFNNTRIEVNIPEFKLRIFQDSLEMYSFPIRVGQNKKKYLKMGNRVTDLRTKTGVGIIIRHEKNPDFYNPVNGRQFYLTKRDDEKTTVMPQIPWIETEINGVRNGQMIHPTTNPESLGKAYSNGCIGTKEADAWIIYYHAPLGTSVEIRYDLRVKDPDGKELLLENIYGRKD
jgi:L,D-transpeptidase ErfK/SrfK